MESAVYTRQSLYGKAEIDMKEMNSRERVLAAFHRTPADRVPVDYLANPGIDARLKARFGLAQGDDEGLRQALDVDIRGVGPIYVGPQLHQPVHGRDVDIWGIHRRYVEHETGGYWDYCDFPLREADEETVARWPMPDPDGFDYASLRAQCCRHRGRALYTGGAGLGCVINTAGFFRGMEQVFVDLITDDPAGMLLIDRFLDVQYEQTVRTLNAVGKDLDFIWMGEDLGTQLGPLISRAIFLKHILPRQQRFFDLARAYGLPVLFHTCGSSSWAYEDYIQAGVAGMDTLQPECADMSPAYLAARFGGRLSFHGCISTAGPLAGGTPEDVVKNVLETLEIMMPNRGYMLSPTHEIQDNTPTENVIAMYEAAREFGIYE